MQAPPLAWRTVMVSGAPVAGAARRARLSRRNASRELPAELPAAFAEDAHRFGFRSSLLWDSAAEPLPDEIGRAVRDYADRQVDAVQRTIFPLHDL
ncbi:MAG: hypothetical protein WED01_05020 [Candidatus Rokuibacteriota bacterium]